MLLCSFDTEIPLGIQRGASPAANMEPHGNLIPNPLSMLPGGSVGIDLAVLPIGEAARFSTYGQPVRQTVYCGNIENRAFGPN